MKVRIELTVDVDVDAWRSEFPEDKDADPAAIRHSVREYVWTLIDQAAVSTEADAYTVHDFPY
ncbi:hypothetical protein [Gordonia malaquae]|uniref:hypothetical protein n=1 Tax=Gordonia malaquae TaxID=410332 RepID=UPI00301A74FD